MDQRTKGHLYDSASSRSLNSSHLMEIGKGEKRETRRNRKQIAHRRDEQTDADTQIEREDFCILIS